MPQVLALDVCVRRFAREWKARMYTVLVLLAAIGIVLSASAAIAAIVSSTRKLNRPPSKAGIRPRR